MDVHIVQICSHMNILYGLDSAGGLWQWVESLDGGQGRWKAIAGGLERGEPKADFR